MKLINQTGCICYEVSADGVSEADMTDEQRKETIDAIYRWMQENPNQLINVMQSLTKELGDYECDDHCCECCGDIVETWTWEI